MNNFKKAAFDKVRFEYKGLQSSEDLCDLSEQSLDGLYRKLQLQAKDLQTGGLIEKKTTKSRELDLKLAIVKSIFDTKVKKREAQEQRILNTQRKQKLLELREKKQDEKAGEMSVEDLDAAIAACEEVDGLE